MGDGGAVTTNDPRMADRVRSLRAAPGRVASVTPTTCSRSRGRTVRARCPPGRMLDVKARHLERGRARASKAAGRYRALLARAGGESPSLRAPEGATHVCTTSSPSPAAAPTRSPRTLASNGIASRAYYARPPIAGPRTRASTTDRAPLPNTEAASRELLAIPMFAEITSAHRSTSPTHSRVRHASVLLKGQAVATPQGGPSARAAASPHPRRPRARSPPAASPEARDDRTVSLDRFWPSNGESRAGDLLFERPLTLAPSLRRLEHRAVGEVVQSTFVVS